MTISVLPSSRASLRTNPVAAQALREGLTYASVSRLQTRYRVLYAVVGLAMVAGLCVAIH